jgi:hypothetical protein
MLRGYALVGGNEGDVDVIDVRDPSRPRNVGSSRLLDSVHFLVRDEGRTVAVGYVGGQYGLHVLDDEDPAVLRSVGQQALREWAAAVLVDGPMALVAPQQAGSLDVLDLADPLRPVRLAELPVGDVVPQLTLAGAQLLVATDTAGLWVYDRADLRALRTVWGPGE